VASHTITMDANKSCTANFTPTTIAVPSTPVVAANTAGATTTFSWGAASCPGNTARYQYRYTISPSGYDSGIVATAAISVAFTTSTEGQTYTVATQAECYNAATSSGMSAAGTASYYRPVPTTVSGGTVSYNGAYTIRTFTSSGTLTVTGGTLTGVSVLVIGGGGGGGTFGGGGGGAGQLASFTVQSFSVTGHTVTIDPGGLGYTAAHPSAPTTGGASSVDSLSAAGGGNGGVSGVGAAGASGGGGSGGYGRNGANAGGSATAGYAGGAGRSNMNYPGAGGGGGAGAIGADTTSFTGANGGAGAQDPNNLDGSGAYYAGQRCGQYRERWRW